MWIRLCLTAICLRSENSIWRVLPCNWTTSLLKMLCVSKESRLWIYIQGSLLLSQKQIFKFHKAFSKGRKVIENSCQRVLLITTTSKKLKKQYLKIFMVKIAEISKPLMDRLNIFCLMFWAWNTLMKDSYPETWIFYKIDAIWRLSAKKMIGNEAEGPIFIKRLGLIKSGSVPLT